LDANAKHNSGHQKKEEDRQADAVEKTQNEPEVRSDHARIGGMPHDSIRSASDDLGRIGKPDAMRVESPQHLNGREAQYDASGEDGKARRVPHAQGIPASG